jgi:hypothetical protein
MSSNDKLRVFEELVRTAPVNEKSERFVRDMISGIAWSCPIQVLVQLAQCVIDSRQAELRDEASRN